MKKSEQKVVKLWLFTNRNVMAFDEAGEQVIWAQAAIGCYNINKKLALKATLQAQEFHLARWREWERVISREEMQYLLGVRTDKMDMEDLNSEQDRAR